MAGDWPRTGPASLTRDPIKVFEVGLDLEEGAEAWWEGRETLKAVRIR
jgi:hypothetical protein